jgi:hypothetical protein
MIEHDFYVFRGIVIRWKLGVFIVTAFLSTVKVAGWRFWPLTL